MHLRCSQVDVVAEITHEDGREGVAIKKKQVPALELEKLLEDVRNGIYPLTGERATITPCMISSSRENRRATELH